jgi:hypothetical protein
MINAMRMFALLAIALALVTCGAHFDQKDVVGTYVALDYVNCIDTIRVLPSGLYERRVYASDRSLALGMQGKWTLDEVGDGQITFYSFFLNLDRDLLKYPELVSDTALKLSVELESLGGSVGFCTGYYDGKNCYRRIKE